METEKYNGWTNYATWRVNLEMFDGFDPREWWQGSFETAYDLGIACKELAEERILSDCGPGALTGQNLAADYAMAFLSDVNWTEIARHMIEYINDK